MSARVVGVLAEALAEHDYDISEVHQRMCVCGEKVDDMPRHRASVVAALPNIAVVQLPAPDPFGRWVVSPFYTQFVEVSEDQKMIGIVDRLMPQHGASYSPDRAMILGAAMCAAARAAGGQA